jgi:hypothetical protein
MMASLLTAALLGDLILLPALLASPLGKTFAPQAEPAGNAPDRSALVRL